MTDKYTPSKGDYIKVQGNKQYLPVPNRVQWFRGDHPDWTISTSVVELQWEIGYVVMRAEILDDTGRLIASGMKTETRKGFGDFVEKAETGAVGRALARTGYGTEDALDLEGDRYADAPIQQPGQAPKSEAQPAPAPTTYRRGELHDLMIAKGLDTAALEQYARLVGIPENERPLTNESMDRLIAAVQGHGTDEPLVLSQPEAASVPDAAPAPPPRPGTDEYKALPTVAEKATARAYWAEKDAEERQPDPVNPEQTVLPVEAA